MVRQEGLGKLKKISDHVWTRPATFRLGASTNYTTACPHNNSDANRDYKFKRMGAGTH
jgi:hypothetical protein